MPANGFLDFHSHVIPGIDDGCQSLDDSLACIQTLIDHGFSGTVCTPHMCVGGFPDNTPAEIAIRVVALSEQLKQAGLDYRLWPGGEVRIAENTVAWFREHGVPTLGPSRCVLVDYWGRSWPGYADLVIDYLFDEGYQPILGHPERMNFPDGQWQTALERLQARGVLLQGNLKCLAGREGTQQHARAQMLLSAGRYHLLATDMHRPGPDLLDRLAGIQTAQETVGPVALESLLRRHQQAILA